MIQQLGLFCKVLVFASVLLVASEGRSAESYVDLDLSTVYSTNIFSDKSQVAGASLRPSGTLGLDFGEYWSASYGAELNYFLDQPELLSHWHELVLFANPFWGKKSRSEFVGEASLEILRNDPAYAILNNVRGGLLFKLMKEPHEWLRWQLSLDGAYRLFTDDRPYDAADIWLEGEVGFTLISKTTISPYLAAGTRFYPRQQGEDTSDQQIEAGLRISQSLSDTTGAFLNFQHTRNFGDSVLLRSKLTEDQFAYLGNEFLNTGFKVGLGLNQMAGKHFMLRANLNYQERVFGGWLAIDENGMLTGSDRTDKRWMPSVGIDWTLSDPKNKNGNAGGLGLQYQLISQTSNSDWYQADAHRVGLSGWLSF